MDAGPGQNLRRREAKLRLIRSKSLQKEGLGAARCHYYPVFERRDLISHLA